MNAYQNLKALGRSMRKVLRSGQTNLTFLTIDPLIDYTFIMYTEGMNKTQKTVHKNGCERVFKNYDKSCARCQELAGGSPAREGWGERAKRYGGNVDNWKMWTKPCCKNNLNPGGYCNVCGDGRDFS